MLLVSGVTEVLQKKIRKVNHWDHLGKVLHQSAAKQVATDSCSNVTHPARATLSDVLAYGVGRLVEMSEALFSL